MANKPLKLWVKILLFAVIAVLVSSIAVFPSAFKAAIAYEKGREAQQEGRHSTAIKEFEKVRQKYPEASAVLARLAVSYFYNERIDECSELLDRLAGKKLSRTLSRKVNGIVEKMDLTYYQRNELLEAIRLYGMEELEKTAEKVKAYLSTGSNDPMGLFHLANIFYDMGKYNEAEEYYIKAVELQPGFYSAYMNLAAVYRVTGRLEQAEEACNKVLESNLEHPQAFAALSKIELAKKDYIKALEYAKKAYEYDGGDLSIISNLAIAYHYNKMNDDRDALLQILQHNNYYDLTALQSVFED